jgi:multicomponent Na+:H+ antiporter subunit D
VVLGALCARDAARARARAGRCWRARSAPVAAAASRQQVELDLRVDAMGALFAATVAVLFLLALVYSAGHLRRDGRETRYYAFFMLSFGWMLGVAFAGNLVTLLVFYELFSILVYPLVVHEETPRRSAPGTKYIVYILSAAA